MRYILGFLALAGITLNAAGPKKMSALLEAGAPAYVVEFRDPAQARAAAGKLRFRTREHPGLHPRHLLVAEPLERIVELAGADEVARVFPASPELLNGEHVAACMGAVIENEVTAQFSTAGSGWPRTGDFVDLGYHLGTVTDRLEPSLAQAEILRALREWALHAPLRFFPVIDPAGVRTISIRFAEASHGDPYPFDGPGRVLAHAFYPSPPNPEPIAGDIHLDGDEEWNTDGRRIDLFAVVLHELGHVLGLGHTDRPGAVMYPYYQTASALADDDIAGLQALYGARTEPETGSPQAEKPTPRLAVSITSPAHGDTTTAGSIQVRGKITGGSGATQVRLETDRGYAGGAAGGEEWSLDSVPLSIGANLITATAIDSSGATKLDTITVTRVVEPDPPARTAALNLRITFPALSIVSSSAPAIVVRGTSTGAERVTWTTSAGPSGDANGVRNWTAEIPLLAGANSVTIRAIAAGGAVVAWRTLTVVRH